MWSSAEIVVPVVIGALGSVPKDLEKCLNLIGLEKWTISVLQKTFTEHLLHIETLFNTLCHC